MKNLNVLSKTPKLSKILSGWVMILLFSFFSLGSETLKGQACPTAPTISAMTFSPADVCTNGNHAVVNATVAPVTPGTGYEYRYSLDGSPVFANSLPSGVPAGPHCVTVGVFATTNVTCGGNTYTPGMMIPSTTTTYSIFFGTNGPPALAAASIVGNLTCAATISVIPNPLYSCFSYEYSIDGGAYSATIPATLSRGCHTISYRLNTNSAGFFGCGSGNPTPVSAVTNFVLFDDLSTANITVNTTCSDGSNGTVSSVTGLPPAPPNVTYEYSLNGGAYSTALPTGMAPRCHDLMIRQMANCDNSTADGDSPSACRKVHNFVVYPTPPVITPSTNTCNAMFTLPTVTPVTGFTVEYSLDGGAWTANPSSTTPGCHSIAARYVTESACGGLPFNIVPAGSSSDGTVSSCSASSNTVNTVIFPEAPVLTAPTNTCAAAFTLPTVTSVTGFNVQWSINGGAFTGSPVLPATPGCYNLRAQYVLASACGATPAGATGTGACGISNTVNVVIFPQVPTITPPANTCNAAFVLPTVSAVPGFTVQYSIDGGIYVAAPTVPSTSGCYTVTARYVLTADCGVAPANVITANTAAPAACAAGNTVSVVIFPTAPVLTQPASTCNAMFTLPTVTPVTGFTVEYELDMSGSWSAAPSTTLAGCYSVRARYVLAAACGTNLAGASSADAACAASAPVSALIYPAAPVITAPANTCNAAFTLPTVPTFAGFTTQYSIDGGAWGTAPSTTAIGCHNISARYVNTSICGTVPSLTAGPTDCASSNTVDVVIFPTAPTISFSAFGAIQTTAVTCDAVITPASLIFVRPLIIGIAPELLGFDLEYSSNGGATWLNLADFVASANNPGCYEIKYRWTLMDDCGSTLAGTPGTGACGASTSIYLLKIPNEPTITATANTCAAMFDLPTVTAVPGFNVQYSIDNGTTWSANPSTTTPGCYSVRARYVSASACGTIPANTPGTGVLCNQSNAVQMTIFPDVTSNITSITKASTCGNTNISVNWDVVPAVVAGFELRYSLDGGAYNTTLPTNIAPGCHSLSVRYALTAACGATAAGTVSPGDDCEATRTFIVWPDLSALTPTVSMAANCGSTTNVSTVTLSAPVSIPTGMELVYTGSNNGTPFGPVNLAGLQAIAFNTGCHNIRVGVGATTTCGAAPDGAAIGDVAPNACRSLSIDFITFPAPPTLTVTPVCSGGSLTAVPSSTAPAGYGWRYRLVNTVTNTVVGGWQFLPVWINPAVGCYEVEVVPVRTANCGAIVAGTGILFASPPVYPSNIQNPLNMQTGAIINAVPASFNAACVGSQDAFVLPAPPMAITPNNITVCLGDNGKIDLQYFEQMVPTCLVDPVTGISSVGAVVSYVVTSSDPLVVMPGTLNSLPNNAPELMWMGENGNNFPNVVTIGVTPQITLDGVTCTGAEVKFSITVQPNFTTTGGWQTSPNTAVQCANNNGWTVSTIANTDAACTYELYYNLSTSPLANPIGNALVQTIAGNGAPVSFQPVFIPGTYQIWQRCGGCAELAVTFTLSIIDAPVLTDVLLETCPTTPGGNSGTFTGITYALPTVPAPQTITVLGYYNSFNNANNGGATGLISATAPFDYISSDAAIYVRIGHNVDGLPGDDCFYIGTIELRVVNRPIVTLTAIENPSCINQDVQLISTVVAGSGVGYTYSWERVSPTAGSIAGTTGSVTVTETTPGDYVYRLTVTDPNNGTNGSNGPACTSVADITVTYTGPIITCPADFTAATDAGSCTTFMNLIPAEINAACADEFTVRYWVTGATTIASMAAPVTLTTVNATAFNVGVNTVHAIAGTLVSGVFTPLTPTVSCNYTATVQDFEEPIARCKDIAVFLNAAGTASIVAADVNGGSTDNCTVSTVVATPLSFTCANIGANNVTLTVTDASGNSSTCIANVTVVDAIAPTLVCPANITMNVSSNTVCTWTSGSLAPVTNTDNCTVPPVLTYSILNPDQTVANGAGAVNAYVFAKGTSVVTYSSADASGNISVCTFTVTVVDNVLPLFTGCPENITVNITNAGFTVTPSAPAGGFVITQPATANDCSVNIAYTAPVASDNCPMFVTQLNNGKGAAVQNYGAGTHTESYLVTDMSGNTAICSFVITVVDDRDPVITCPTNVTVGTDPSSGCTAFVPLQPTVSDNCSDVAISHFFGNGAAAPSQLPNPAATSAATAVSGFTSGLFYPGVNGVTGTTTVTFIATDLAGNTRTCSVDVTVTDDDAPVVSCPQDITLNANATCVGVLPTPYAAVFGDNCMNTGLTVTYAITGATTANSPATGQNSVPTSQTFNLGTSFVTYTVTDAAGNRSTCTATVVVRDVTAPVVVCPAVLSVYFVPANACVVNIPLVATATDNCSVASLNHNDPFFNTGGDATGNYGPGFYTIDFMATDGSGNTSLCSVSFEVRDNITPTITCPSNVALTTGAGDTDCATIYNWTHPTPTDNCTINLYTYVVELPNGVIDGPFILTGPLLNGGSLNASYNFPRGTTRVRYVVRDVNGNSQTCFFDVTVTDNTVPVFVQCPVDFTASNSVDLCSSLVTWATPIAADNCGFVNVVRTDAGPVQGGTWPVGTYTVRYVATDGSNNTAVCQFVVTVVDTQIPQVFCPSVTQTFPTDINTCTWTSNAEAVDPRFNFDNCPYTVSYVITGATVRPSTNGSAAGEVFNLGTSTVTYTIREANGTLVGTCSFNIVVVDRQSPTIVCPAGSPFVLNANTNVCNYTVPTTALNATASDNCTGLVSLVNNYTNTNTLQGAVFPVGETRVVWTATDVAGNTSTCAILVRVLDNQLPIITCPSNVALNTGVNDSDCAALHTWTHPTPTDNCGIAIYTYRFMLPNGSVEGPFILTGTLLSGSSLATSYNFPVGTTTVMYAVRDVNGNNQTCSFTVTVTDTTSPEFVQCPVSFTATTSVDACSAVVNWATPIAADNCGIVTVSRTDSGPAQGVSWAVGTYTVRYVATDANNNTSVCTFTVTVTDTQIPQVFCPSVTQTFPTNPNTCTWTSNAEAVDPRFNFDNCPYTVSYVITGATVRPSTNGSAAGVVFNLGTSTVTYTIREANGTLLSSCSFNIVVVDRQSPTIVCPSGSPFVFNANANVCTFTVPATALNATASDNCTGVVSLVNSYNNTATLAGAIFPVGTTTVVWTATDVAGNTSTCSIVVTVLDTQLPVITCPSNASLNTGTGDTDCAALHTWNHPTPTDNCAIGLYTYRFTLPNGSVEGPFVLTGTLLSGSSLNTSYNFPVGTTTVLYSVRDIHGNNQSCSFTVTVTDNSVPTFVQCPGSFTATNSVDLCSSVVNWATPIATDNCGFVTVVRTDAGPAQGTGWALGTYIIRYLATDANNNTAVCTFTVTVTDTQNPDIFCPSVTQTFPTDNNTCTWASTAEAVAPRFNFDNCPYTVTYAVTGATTASGNTNATGVVFNLGRSTVTYTIMDGNTSVGVCSFVIEVVDRQRPNIVCPTGSPFVFDANANVCNFTVPATALNATATDNCTGVVSLVNSFNNSATLAGAVFPVGTTTVVWTATDVAGNTSTCAIVVTVRDTQNPTVSCAAIPTNPLVTEIFRCESQMSWTHPVPADNCAVTVYTYSITNPDGTVAGPFTLTQLIAAGGNRNVAYDFEEGLSVLRYYVRDAAGNEGSCSLNITVVDRAMPFFTNCPSMIMVNNDVDRCSAKVNWDIPYAVDNCDVPLTVVAASTNQFVPGDVIPVGGPYTIRYTATDNDGNTATCTFTILVLDSQQPEILVGKPQNITVECDNVPAPLVLNPNDVEDNCTAAPTIAFVQNSTKSPNQALCAHYNYTLTNIWTVRDVSNNAQVWNQVVTVRDSKAPEITVPINVTVECAGPYVAKSFVCNPAIGSYAPTATFAEYGVAAAVDNCAPSPFICVEFTETFAPGTCGFTGVITRTWTATDPCGNRSSGVQRITIRDTRPPVFTCKNINVDLDADGKVSITAGDVIVGGIAGATDACSVAADLTFQLSKLNFTCADLGPNQVLVKVIDDCGNEAACFATVTVRDVTKPTILCPGNQTFRLGSGQCTFLWPGAVPTTDNCSAVVTYSPSNLNLPIGTTVITATATDIAGNTATCSFTVVVQENIPSNTISCNDHINLSLDTNCEARINPDMLLEGNDYRCFDRYCIVITTLGGLPHANFFDISDKDQTFKVSIVDCNGTGNSCWGTVTIEEKLVPEINCPANVTVTCNTDVNERFVIVRPDGSTVLGALKTGEAFLRTCKPGAVITYKDWFDDRGQCATPRAIITRTWTSTYGNGETVSCDQIITIEGLNLNNIVWPADFTNDKALDCTDVKQTPSLTNAANTGFPSLNGTSVNKTGNLCMVSVNVSDEIFEICPGSYEILRTWKVRNMCLPLSSTNPREHVQVIKVSDTKGPKIIECPDDITIGVDPWGCVAHADLPVPAVMVDGCSSVASFTAKVFGTGRTIVTGGFLGHDEHDIKVRVEGLEKGRHLVEYTIMDECGNISRCYYYVTVGDFSPPVAIGLQNIVLSLTGGEGDGFAKLYAESVDNGSYDHCSDVKLEIRRLGGGSCGNIGANNHNNNSTYNHSPADNVPGGVWAHPEDTKDNNIIIDTDGGEYVKFCCEDIPVGAEFGLHDVEMRVWDDGNMNGVYGDNLIINGMRDNYNTTWVTVRVENKLPPVLVCPANVTVTCDMELNLSLDADTPVSTNITMTGLPKAYDLCSNLDVTYRDQWVGQFNDVCKNGTLRRTFKVTKGSTVVTCVQLITVSSITAPFTVTFPQNNGTTEWDKCSFELADARDANNPVIKKPIVNYGQCDIVGESIKIDTFLFEDGACKKWRVEYSYKNWCTGEDRGPFVHWYAFKDEIAPVLTCQDQMFAANPNAQNPNGGCEAQVALEASASDALVCAEESWVKWQMYFDGWANGTIDRLASSFVNKSWNGIWVAQARLLATGAPNPVWAQLQAQHPGLPFADLVYVTYIKPTKASGETVKIPVGTGPTAFILDAENISHKVLWKVTDGCGNVAQCENTVMVVDKKAPTPYCVNISTAVMQTTPKMVELWAGDFDKGSFDNCTPQAKLYFTFDNVSPIFARINDEHFYKAGASGSVNATAAEYAQGKAFKWLPSSRSAGKVWTACGDFTVNVSVWDEAWNTDFCSTLLSIRGCDTNKPVISGTVVTSTGNAVKNITVTFETNLPEFPKTIQPDALGNYAMEVESDMNYEVSAAKDGDYLNGVTTLDLVLIQRHILGLDVFNDTYKVIASDANNDSRVTASDLTELRKVILGVNDAFRNSSWRFPVKSQTLDTKNPFPYTDAFEYQGLNDTKTGQDFVAVKIGDVNSSATTDVIDPITEPRSSTGIIFNVDEINIEAGESVEIPVTAANMETLAGFQFTMNIKDAKFLGVNSGSLDINNSNVGVLDNGNVTMSYAAAENVTLNSSDVLFTIMVKADKAITLSEMLSLNSNVTKAESYTGDLKVAGVKLNVRTAPVAAIELFQNEPNPFRGQTSVSFSMPQAATATLSVYDLTGKLVVLRNIDAVKGMNNEVFTKEQLGASGVLYYTLESGDFTATKKMIIVE